MKDQGQAGCGLAAWMAEEGQQGLVCPETPGYSPRSPAACRFKAWLCHLAAERACINYARFLISNDADNPSIRPGDCEAPIKSHQRALCTGPGSDAEARTRQWSVILALSQSVFLATGV